MCVCLISAKQSKVESTVEARRVFPFSKKREKVPGVCSLEIITPRARVCVCVCAYVCKCVCVYVCVCMCV